MARKPLIEALERRYLLSAELPLLPPEPPAAAPDPTPQPLPVEAFEQAAPLQVLEVPQQLAPEPDLVAQDAAASGPGSEPALAFIGATPLPPGADPRIPQVPEELAPAVLLQAAPSAPQQTLVFVDASVADHEQLVDSLLSRGGVDEPAPEIVVLNAGRDGLQQITEALAGRSDIAAIHILSHGSAGALQLGSTVIDSARLSDPALATWASALSPDGDILLYGCNIADGAAGIEFVQRLAQATSADVAASSDRTGAASLGGDWQLEVNAGEVLTPSLFAAGVDYAYLLNNIPGNAGNDTFTFVTGTPGALQFTWGDTVNAPVSGGADTATFANFSGALSWSINASGNIVVTNVATPAQFVTLQSITNVIGGTGNDSFVFNGGSIAGTLDGNGGTADTLDYSALASVITVNLGTGAATNVGGGVAAKVSNVENVTGGSAGDTLTGDGNANTLTGGGGNDIIDGAGGADSLVGGTNNDTYNFSSGFGTDTITENASEGSDSIVVTGTAGADTINVLQGNSISWSGSSVGYGGNVESIQVNAGDGNDIITVEKQGNAAVTVVGGVGTSDSLTIDAMTSGVTLGTSSVSISGGQTVTYDSTTETVTLQNAIVSLDSEALGQIESVLQALKNFAGNIDTLSSWETHLPLSDQELVDLTQPEAIFTNLYDDFVLAHIAAGSTMTAIQINTFLDGWAYTAGGLSVTVDTVNSGTSTISFVPGTGTEVMFRLKFTAAQTATVELSAADALVNQNLLFNDAADFDVASALNVDFKFGVVVRTGVSNDTGQVEFTTLSGTANASDTFAGNLTVGVLGGAVSGGTASLSLSAPIVFIDPSPLTKLTATDLGMPISTLVSVTPTSSFGLSMLFTPTAGVTGAPAAETIALSSGNIYNDAFGPKLTMSDTLRSFSVIDRDDLWDPLVKIHDWLGTLEGTDLYDGLLPIVKDVRLGDVLDLDLALRDDLLARVGHVVSVTGGGTPVLPQDLGITAGNIQFSVSLNGGAAQVFNVPITAWDNPATTPAVDLSLATLRAELQTRINTVFTSGQIAVTLEGQQLKFSVTNSADRIALAFTAAQDATALGFTDAKVALVPDFTTVQQLVSGSLGRLTAAYDGPTETLSFAVAVSDANTVNLPFFFNFDVDPLTGVQVTGTTALVNIGTTVGLGFTFGIDLTPTDAASVLATSNYLEQTGDLTGTATFSLKVGAGVVTPVTLNDDGNNTSLANLQSDLNAAIAAAPALNGVVTAFIEQSSPSLDALGNPVAGGYKIRFAPTSPSDTIAVSGTNLVARNELGLVDGTLAAPLWSFATTHLVSTPVGALSATGGDATFTLYIGGGSGVTGVPFTVLQSSTTGNANLAALVADIQSAINAVGALTGKVTVGSENGLLKFSLTPAANADFLRVEVSPGNAAIRQLGFINGQVDLASSLAPTFVNEAGGSITGTVNLAFDAATMAGQFGFVGLDIVDASARGTVTSTVTFNDIDGVTEAGGARIAISDLVSGLNSPYASNLLALSDPVNLRLSADAMFSLKVGNDDPVQVTVTKASTDGNTLGPEANPLAPDTVNDNAVIASLAADVNAALAAAGLNGQVKAVIKDGRLTFAAAPGKTIVLSGVNTVAGNELGLSDGLTLLSALDAPVYSGALAATTSTSVNSLIASTAGADQFAFYLSGWAAGQPHDAAHAITNNIVKANLVAPSDTAETELGLVDGLTAAGVLLAPRPSTVGGGGSGRLTEDAHFSLTVNGVTATVTVAKESTLSNASLADLVQDVNAALSAAGFSDTVAGLEGDRIKLWAKALSASSPLNLNDPVNFRLNNSPTPGFDGSFSISLDGAAAILVNIESAATTANTTAAQLVADINDALAGAGLAADVQALIDNGRLKLASLLGKSLQVSAVTGVASTELGLANGQTLAAFDPDIAIDIARPYSHTITATPAENVFRNASFLSVMDALRNAGDFLAESGAAPILLEQLPLVGKSGSSLNDFDAAFTGVLQQIGLREAGTTSLGLMKSTIDQVLSQAYGSVNVDFVFNGDDLDIDIGFVNATSTSIGFPLDLPGLTKLLPGGVSPKLHGLADLDQNPLTPDEDVFVTLVDGTGTIDMAAASEATVNIEVGVDYTATPQSFIEDTSSVVVTVTVDEPDLDFTALVGSNAVSVEDGTYQVNATYTIGLDPAVLTSGRYAFTGVDSTGFGANDIDGVLGGTGDVALPLSHPVLVAGDGLFIQIADLGAATDDPATPLFDPADGSVAMAGQIADLLPIYEASNRIIDLLRNPEVIISGIDRILGSVQGLLQSSLSTLGYLPLIGDQIMTGLDPFFDAMAEMRGEVRNFLESAWKNLTGGENETDLILLLQNTLVSLFHTDLGLLKDRVNDGDAVIDIRDLGLQERDALNVVISDPGYVAYDPFGHPNPNDPTDESLQFNLHLGQDFSVLLPFNLGLRVGDLDISELLPNFGFDLEGNVQFDFAWNIRLGFGLSISEGFFLDSEAKDFSFDPIDGEDVPEVQLTAEMTIPGTSANVSLALLQAEITDGTDTNATVTAANGMPGSLLAGALGIFSPEDWANGLPTGTFTVQWFEADNVLHSFDVTSNSTNFAGLLVSLNTDADMILNGITARPDFSDVTSPKLVLTASRAPDILRMNIVGGENFGFLTNQHEDARAVGLGFDSDVLSEGGLTVLAEFDAPVNGIVQKDIVFDLHIGSGTPTIVEVKLLKRHLEDVASLQDLVDRLNIAIDLAIGEAGFAATVVQASVNGSKIQLSSPTETLKVGWDPQEHTRFVIEAGLDLKDPSGEGRVSISELVGQFSEVLVPEIKGRGELRLAVDADAQHITDAVNAGIAALESALGVNLPLPPLSLPSVEFNFVTDFGVSLSMDPSIGELVTENFIDYLRFRNIEVNLGETLTLVVKPIIELFGDILGPLAGPAGDGADALLGFLNEPVPILTEIASFLGISDSFSLLDFTGNKANFNQFINTLQQMFQLIEMVDDLVIDPAGLVIPLGSWVIDLNPKSKTYIGKTKFPIPEEVVDSMSSLDGDMQTILGLLGVDFSTTNEVSVTPGGFKFELLSMNSMINLILGNPFDIFSFSLPELELDLGLNLGFGISGGGNSLSFGISGGVKVHVNLGIAYDSTGIDHIADAINRGETADFLDIFDGFYVKTEVGPEVSLHAYFNGGGGVRLATPSFCIPEIDFGLFSIPEICFPEFVIFAVQANASLNILVGLDLADPNEDGKLRLDEIFELTQNFTPQYIFNLFDITASLSGSFFISATVLGVTLSSNDLGLGALSFSIDISLQDILGSFGLLQPPPARLAEVITESPTVNYLRINAGAYDYARIFGDVDDATGANVVVTNSGGNIVVAGYGTTRSYSSSGITKIVAVGREGNDVFDFSGMNLNIPVEMKGGLGDDTLKGGAGNDKIMGGLGNDRLEGGGGDDNLQGEKGADTLRGGYLGVTTGTGNDTLIGGADNDVLEGADGQDQYVFLPRWGRDTLTETGSEFDTADFSQIFQNLSFTLGTGSTLVSDGVNTLTSAGLGVETLLGGSGNDNYLINQVGAQGITMKGGDGSDDYTVFSTVTGSATVLDVGQLYDRDRFFVFGTPGADTVGLTNTSAVFVNASNVVTGTVTYGGGASGLEVLVIDLQGGDDTVRVESTPTTMSVAIAGGTGNDTFHVGMGATSGTATNLNLIDGTQQKGPLVLTGGADFDTFNAYDTTDVNATNTGQLSDKSLSGLGITVAVNYETMEAVNVDLSTTAADTLTVLSTINGPVTVDAGGGNDVITVVNVSSTIVVNGQGNNDKITLAATGLGSISTLNGDAGSDTINVQTTQGTVIVNGGSEDDIVNVGSTAGALVPAPGDVNGILASVTIQGGTHGTGGDTLNVDDAADALGFATNSLTLTGSKLDGMGMGTGVGFGITYGTFENMNIGAGAGNLQVDVQGTSAATVITLNGTAGNDVLNVSSDAPLHLGNVDAITANLTLHAGAGLNTLNVSDRSATVGNSVMLSNNRITGLAAGFIHYDTAGAGRFSGGVNIWMGSGDTPLLVNSTRAGDVTEIFGNSGSATTTLDDTSIGGPADGLLILHGDLGADPVVLSGAGWNNDTIIFGDEGVVTYAASTTRDFNNITSIATTNNASGGADSIVVGNGRNILFGGAGADGVITTGSGNDIVFGDNGSVTFATGVANAYASTGTDGGAEIISAGAGNNVVVGGVGGDTITTLGDRDWVIGDNGSITLDPTGARLDLVTTTDPAAGGADTINVGDGDNIVIGGLGIDQITATAGSDILLGDNGEIDFNVSNGLPFLYRSTDTLGDSDTILAGAGTNVVIGGAGGDTITALGGRDWVLGDFGSITLDPTGAFLDLITSTDLTSGGDDNIAVGDGNNIVIGGLGAESSGGKQILAGTGNDALMGDNAEIDFNALTGAAILYRSLDTNGGADSIVAGAGNNVVIGGVGNDSVTSGAGRDWVLGDNGSITLEGSGAFLDLIQSTDLGFGGADSITVSDGDNIVVGGLGVDPITAGAGNDVLIGDNGEIDYNPTNGNAILYRSTDTQGGGEVIAAGGGNNVVIGGVGGDTITSDIGHDWVLGDNGSITLDPTGARLDRIVTTDAAAGAGDSITVSDGNNIVIGGLGIDPITAGSGNDILLGDNGEIDYNAGNGLPILYRSTDTLGDAETIVAGAGINVVIGGAGGDTITALGGRDWVLGDFGSITLDPTGTFLDLVTSTDLTSGGDDNIAVGDGNNIVIGGVGAESGGGKLISAGAGNDVLMGDNAEIDYNAGNGKAILYRSLDTNGGADLIDGGGGNNVVIGGVGGDTVNAGIGHDWVLGDNGSISLDASGSFLDLVTTTDPTFGAGDTITVANGDNIVIGGLGIDPITAGSGNDILIGDNGLIDFNPANGLAFLYRSTDTLGAGETITAGDGINVVIAGAGDDTVTAGSGRDWVLGDFGSITLDASGTFLDLVTSTDFSSGGDDSIALGEGDNIAIGGFGAESGGGKLISAGAGNDILMGDNAEIDFNSTNGKAILYRSLGTGTDGGADLIDGGDGNNVVIGGVGGDTVNAGIGHDWVLGDNGSISLDASGSFLDLVTTTDPNDGAGDTLTVSDGDNIVIGGLGIDPITASTGNDILLGDNGEIDFNPSNGLAFLYRSTDTLGAGEAIIAGDGINVVIAGAGGDTVTAGSGRDWVLGDNGSILLEGSGTFLDLITSTDLISGGDDSIMLGDGDNIAIGGFGLESGGGKLVSAGAGNDVLIGDNGEIDYNATNGKAILYRSLDTNGGVDELQAGAGNNVVIGGMGGDTIAAGPGTGADWVLGDNGSIALDASGTFLDRIASELSTGDSDTITVADGDNIVIGGYGADPTTAGTGNDVLIGDNGEIDYNSANGQAILYQTTDTTAATGAGETLTAGDGNNVVLGGMGADFITAGAGHDRIFGDNGLFRLDTSGTFLDFAQSTQNALGGDDDIDAGNGDNIVIGGIGAESGAVSLRTGSGNDVVFGDNAEIDYNETNGRAILYRSPDTLGGADDIRAGEGDNVVFGGAGGDTISAGAGVDRIIGDNGSVALDASGTFLDLAQTTDLGSGGDDAIVAGNGDNFVLGGFGADTVSAGAGNDIVLGDNGLVDYNATSGKVILYQSTDTSNATGGDDTITLGDGANVAFGGAGADSITSGLGDDVLLGDNGRAALDASGAVYVTIETTDFGLGVGGDDFLNAGEGRNAVVGGFGGDTLRAGAGNDVGFGDNVRIVFHGTGTFGSFTSTDTSAATGGDDNINLGDGRNLVIGGVGRDTMTLGVNEDNVIGDNGRIIFDENGDLSELVTMNPELGADDFIDAGLGNDGVLGGKGADTIIGGPGDDSLVGDSGRLLFRNYVIIGAQGFLSDIGDPDSISGDDGQDVVIGGAMNDMLTGGEGRDFVIGDSGSVTFDFATDTIRIQSEEFTAGGNDTLVGGNGPDVLIGGQRNDLLNGNLTDDLLFGDDAGVTLHNGIVSTIVRLNQGTLDMVTAALFSLFNSNPADAQNDGESSNAPSYVIDTQQAKLDLLALLQGALPSIDNLLYPTPSVFAQIFFASLGGYADFGFSNALSYLTLVPATGDDAGTTPPQQPQPQEELGESDRAPRIAGTVTLDDPIVGEFSASTLAVTPAAAAAEPVAATMDVDTGAIAAGVALIAGARPVACAQRLSFDVGASRFGAAPVRATGANAGRLLDRAAFVRR